MAGKGVDRDVAVVMLAVLQLVALRHDDPSANGRDAAFEAPVERWRPALLEAGS